MAQVPGRRLLLMVTLLAVLLASPVSAAIIPIDFEGLFDSDPIANTYTALGVTFTNAVALTAGITLNEFETPPHSGVNVAFDEGGPLTLNFTSPISMFSAYFTYVEPLLVTAYSGAVPVRTATSLTNGNLVSTGNPPNEFIQVQYSLGINRIVIQGNPGGGSFVMDDVLFDSTVGTGGGGGGTAPEPGGFALLGTGVFGVFAFRMLRSRSGQVNRQ